MTRDVNVKIMYQNLKNTESFLLSFWFRKQFILRFVPTVSLRAKVRSKSVCSAAPENVGGYNMAAFFRTELEVERASSRPKTIMQTSFQEF